MTQKQVPCPICGTKSLYIPENEFRPFCSKRCRLIDLGAWANEEYSIPVALKPDSSVDDPDADELNRDSIDGLPRH